MEDRKGLDATLDGPDPETQRLGGRLEAGQNFPVLDLELARQLLGRLANFLVLDEAGDLLAEALDERVHRRD